ncbi:16809_t:CDS:2 [Racocetra fulgida]|uniref:16809_t:CDS:1 n=1 Tax=Racocetra fulgida TaxID=60492 RepID=A0A9N8YYI1_9GLOM|nr:16809_t:CDS:2 [Racocetra fulgida]
MNQIQKELGTTRKEKGKLVGQDFDEEHNRLEEKIDEKLGAKS